jgi:hypothetical protein
MDMSYLKPLLQHRGLPCQKPPSRSTAFQHPARRPPNKAPNTPALWHSCRRLAHLISSAGSVHRFEFMMNRPRSALYRVGRRPSCSRGWVGGTPAVQHDSEDEQGMENVTRPCMHREASKQAS